MAGGRQADRDLTQLHRLVEGERAMDTTGGAIGVAIPPGEQGTVELDVVAPQVVAPTPIATELAVTREALRDAVVRDPSRTASPQSRP